MKELIQLICVNLIVYFFIALVMLDPVWLKNFCDKHQSGENMGLLGLSLSLEFLFYFFLKLNSSHDKE